MKFLCVSCDEQMKLQRAEGPNEGSMSVIFECPACGWSAAMLTNKMETQMVRSLGVKIGGRTVPAEPMEMVRNSLSQSRDAAGGADGAPASSQNAGAAHASTGGEIGDRARGPAAEPGAGAAHASTGDPAANEASASKCPFTDMIADAFAKNPGEIAWTKPWSGWLPRSDRWVLRRW